MASAPQASAYNDTLERTGDEGDAVYFARRAAIHDRVTLGNGTSFLPGPKDPSVAHLIDAVLRNGYVILPSIFTPAQVSHALAELTRLEALSASEAGPAAQGGRNPFEGLKTRRVYSLADKTRAFDCFPIHETLLKLNDYFLQKEYLMTSFHTVSVGPGSKAQEIHTDDGLAPLSRPRPLMGIGTMISLDPFTVTNGATTLIPGSHLWPDSRIPKRSDMISATMPPGSVVYFLNTVWHSAGANTTADETRRSLTVQYCQPWMRQYENFTVAQGWEDLDQVPARLLRLMGFSTLEFMGHVDGRSPRAGAEMRRKRLMEWAISEREKEAGERGKGTIESKL